MNQLAAIAEPQEPSNLLAIIDRARTRLADARTSAEVLEAKAIAEMALHYARVTKAANETHADCLRMITRAEMRMADEIDKGQASGQLAKKNETYVQGSDISTLDDLGLDRRRVAEWRETRDAGEQAVEAALSEALADGRAPKKTDIQRHVRGTFGTGENEWYTPEAYLSAAHDVLGAIDLDPASSAAAQKRVRAAKFFTKADDGLKHEWRGRVWLNPPYAQPAIADFVQKMVDEVRAGRVSTAIMLTHNYTDTTWFHAAAGIADAICFTRGRIRFEGAGGELAAPTQGQAFFYFGERTEAFAQRFKNIGFIVRPFTGEVPD